MPIRGCRRQQLEMVIRGITKLATFRLCLFLIILMSKEGSIRTRFKWMERRFAPTVARRSQLRRLLNGHQLTMVLIIGVACARARDARKRKGRIAKRQRQEALNLSAQAFGGSSPPPFTAAYSNRQRERFEKPSSPGSRPGAATKG
jgi:hypothetical protein